MNRSLIASLRAGLRSSDFNRVLRNGLLATTLLTGLAVSAPAATYYVATTGSDTNSGTSSSPWKTPGKAVSSVSAGDTVIFQAGNYGTLTVANKNGTSSAPITFKSTAGATFSAGTYESGYGIYLHDASWINFEGLTAKTSLWPILIERATNSKFTDCTATDAGQEAFHVRYASSYITADGCTISYTGRRNGADDLWDNNTSAPEYDTQRYAEGVYIGFGSTGGDTDGTHHVTIRNCDIHHTRAEAIDMKRGNLHDLIVEGCTIHDIRTKVRAAINVMDGPTGNEYNFIIRNNKIWNIQGERYDSDGIAIRIFGGGVDVYNNVIWNCEYAGIKSESANSNQVRIYNNTVYNGGTNGEIWITSGNNDVKNNIGSTLSNNIASSSGLFVNASTGDFHLQSTASAAINTGVTLSLTSSDIEGVSRPQGSAYDMGAYEYASGGGGTPPSAPTGLSAIGGDAAVSLDWASVTGATSYNVKYGTSSGSYPTVVTGITSSNYIAGGLTNGTTYYFVVTAVSSGGESTNSSQVSATPQSAVIWDPFTTSNSNWTTAAGGTFTITGGRMELTAPAGFPANNANGNIAVHSTTYAGNFEMTAHCQVTDNASSTFEDFTLVFNYVDLNNYYFVNFAASNDGFCNGLFKVAGGTTTQIADFTALISPGVWYDITVRRVGSQVTVLNGSSVVADVAVSGMPTSATKFGLGSKNDVCSFDAFNVDALSSTFSPITIQAEDASVTRSGVTVATLNAGYTGTGYADYPTTAGYCQWSVSVPTAGTYTLSFRYANVDATARTGLLSINGGTATSQSFAGTGSWTTWSNKTITVTLNAGSNTIRLTGPSASPGMANVDSLTVSQ